MFPKLPEYAIERKCGTNPRVYRSRHRRRQTEGTFLYAESARLPRKFPSRAAISRQTFLPVRASVGDRRAFTSTPTPARKKNHRTARTIRMTFGQEIVIELTTGAAFAALCNHRWRVAASGGTPAGTDVWVLWDGGIRAAPRVSRSRGTSRRVGGLVPHRFTRSAKSLQVQSQCLSQPLPSP